MSAPHASAPTGCDGGRYTGRAATPPDARLETPCTSSRVCNHRLRRSFLDKTAGTTDTDLRGFLFHACGSKNCDRWLPFLGGGRRSRRRRRRRHGPTQESKVGVSPSDEKRLSPARRVTAVLERAVLPVARKKPTTRLTSTRLRSYQPQHDGGRMSPTRVHATAPKVGKLTIVKRRFLTV